MAATEKKITLKLLVDKEKNRVVFAESERDFVDILFSFLTLPMGTIVRLLGKQSNLGCLDRLYESVENLLPKYLQTEACKNMLLRPVSDAGKLFMDLAIRVDDESPRGFWCGNSRASKNRKFWNKNEGCPWWSRVENTRCQCGEMMDEYVYLKETLIKENEGVFVKQHVMFMISDDLCIMPASRDGANSLLSKLGVSSGSAVVEQVVEIGRDEVLKILRCSLQSRTPLTDTLIHNFELPFVNLEIKNVFFDCVGKGVTTELGQIIVKLFLSKTDKKVLYGEAGEDFVDFLFSILVLPLGSVVKYVDKNSKIGSICNLYESIENLKVGEFMISEERMTMLLSPKLPPYFGIENQLLHVTEVPPTNLNISRCAFCLFMHHGDTSRTCCSLKKVENVSLALINPKNPSKKGRGRYVKDIVKFMITDELVVEPFSITAVMNSVGPLKKSISDVEEKQICIGEAEVMALLRATLTTGSALSNAFSLMEKRKFRCRYRHLVS